MASTTSDVSLASAAAVPVEESPAPALLHEKTPGNAPTATTKATTTPAPGADDSIPAPAKGDPKTSAETAKPDTPISAPVNEKPIVVPAVTPASTANPARAPPVPEVDSDDELDDLDDMLDEFEAPEPTPAALKGKAPPEPGVPLDEEWAKQLQAGMADLLNDMAENEEMQAQFDALAKELNDAMASASSGPSLAPKPGPSVSASSATAAPAAPAAATSDPADFQAQIKAAMDRMKNSEADVNAAVQDAESDDFLAEMLKQLQSGSGAGGDEDFSGMLVNMMEQLTSKEILYEPMKELCDKYPEWLQKNGHKEKEEDMKRYREQYVVVKEIVDKFEEKTYKDDNEADREYIVERMQKMQSAGAPPTELMGDVPPELALPDDVDPDCGVQ